MDYEEWLEKNGNKPLVITAELVAQLRREGNNSIADRLVHAHQQSLRKLKSDTLKDIRNQDRKIQRFVKKQNHICTYSECTTKTIKYIYCEKHRIQFRKYKHKVTK